ncbi:MAG: IS1380-like element ISMsm12 family transposase [Acidimicrobiales bacterium]
MQASRTLDRVAVTFDDDHAVADAGLMLVASLAQHLDLEDLVNDTVRLGEDRPGYFAPGRKVMTLVHSMIAGGDFINDVDVLRCASTDTVLGHRVMAPSTIGTFLRSFTFGHVRQLDRVTEIALTRAWAAGAGPGDDQLIIDMDSTVRQVFGHDKQGAAYGYTHELGLHPLMASRADTGEVLHTRFRSGNANTARGAQRFVRETLGRARRAGATGEVIVRADSGFWSNKVIGACRAHDTRFSITARQTRAVRAAIDSIPEGAWVPLADYPDDGVCELAETWWGDDRLIVRRTIIIGDQAPLFDTWRHHAFVTDRAGTAADLDAEHRAHAVVELVIRELKDGAWAHSPSGVFEANAAWSVIGTLAHNLLRWTTHIGGVTDGLVVAKTVRRRLVSLPGRMTRSARRSTLHLPTRWPWARAFSDALVRVRAVRPAT